MSQGSLSNVSIDDFKDLVEAFGFHLDRVNGSHHIFKHPNLDELVNLREVHGEAKPYQIRKFLRLVEQYNLQLRD